MNTPNTPAELAAMASDKPKNPYRDPQVLAALQAVSPNKCSLAHLQALTELCISSLRHNCEAMKAAFDGDLNPEEELYYDNMIHSLDGAEALIERCDFIQQYVDG